MTAAKVVLDVLERLWQGKYVARGTYLEAKSLLDPDGSQEGLETNRLDAASSLRTATMMWYDAANGVR